MLFRSVGRYEGGCYIDIYDAFAGSYNESEALDNINVWDFAKGEATIPPTPEAVLRTVALYYRDHLLRGDE